MTLVATHQAEADHGGYVETHGRISFDLFGVRVYPHI